MKKAKKKAKSRKKIVCAQEFHLTDSRGNLRCAIWTADTDDGELVSLTLNDSRNFTRIHLTVNGDGTPQFGLLREDGSVAAGIGISPYFGTGININDKFGSSDKFVPSFMDGHDF